MCLVVFFILHSIGAPTYNVFMVLQGILATIKYIPTVKHATVRVDRNTVGIQVLICAVFKCSKAVRLSNILIFECHLNTGIKCLEFQRWHHFRNVNIQKLDTLFQFLG